jgi:glycosyltransferase involved in cell wall biosynthesis
MKVGVISPTLRLVRTVRLGSVSSYRFQVEEEDDQGVLTLRALGWSVPRLHSLNRRVWLWLARRMLHQYIARHGRPDVIHVHSALMAGWPTSVLSRELRIPYLITEHSSSYAGRQIKQWQVPLIRAAFAGAERVVAVSHALARDLAPYTGETPVEVVPNLVDTTFFTLPVRPRGGGKFRFLSMGLSTRIKGMDVLLRAFADAFRGRDAELEVGGGSQLEGSLRQLAKELGIAGQVRFLGMLTPEGVREAMWRADALVLSSHVETFGVVLIEAMATGLPVVATACGGPEDIVHPGTGLLVPPGDSRELARGMEALWREAPEWTARAGTIRAQAQRHFSQPVVVRALADLYERILATSGPGALGATEPGPAWPGSIRPGC